MTFFFRGTEKKECHDRKKLNVLLNRKMSWKTTIQHFRMAGARDYLEHEFHFNLLGWHLAKILKCCSLVAYDTSSALSLCSFARSHKLKILAMFRLQSLVRAVYICHFWFCNEVMTVSTSCDRFQVKWNKVALNANTWLTMRTILSQGHSYFDCDCTLDSVCSHSLFQVDEEWK